MTVQFCIDCLKEKSYTVPAIMFRGICINIHIVHQKEMNEKVFVDATAEVGR